jgi:putative tryptophan/tyrosine transport system substrate-binding protein
VPEGVAAAMIVVPGDGRAAGGQRMRRRAFMTGGVAALAWPRPGAGQQAARPHRIGMLTGKYAADAVVEGMTELGHREGQTFVIERRDIEGRFERLPEAVDALLRVPVDVFVVGGSEFVQALQKATQRVPVVFTSVGDPLEQGFIASYARPGGNMTGVTNMVSDLTGKWLELLKELRPGITRVAVLWNPPQPAHRGLLKALQAAAASLHLHALEIAVQSSEDLEPAFATIRRARVGGLTMLGSIVHFRSLARIAAFAQQARLPAIAWTSAFTDVGGLLSYGVSEGYGYRRAATYVDRILKGARPGELPVEQPSKFEMTINLKTARAIDLAVPASLRLRADRVIE